MVKDEVPVSICVGHVLGLSRAFRARNVSISDGPPVVVPLHVCARVAYGVLALPDVWAAGRDEEPRFVVLQHYSRRKALSSLLDKARLMEMGRQTIRGNLMEVYILSHLRNEEELDGYKTIGVFSSEEKAKEAIERLKSLPGFRDYPENFNIGGYQVDKTFWVGGFGFE